MKRRPTPFSLTFLLFHTLLLLGAVISLFAGRVKISTDFLSMIPANGMRKEIAEAEREFASRQSASVSILVGNEDFDTARRASIELCSSLKEKNLFSSISLEVESMDLSAIQKLASKYRYALMDRETREEILSSPSTFQAEALGRIFGAFTFMPLENIEEDPFLVEERVLSAYIEKLSAITPFMPKEDVLACFKDGVWYVMMQGRLSRKSLDLTNTDNGINLIFDAGDEIERTYTGTQVSYSGIPFHSLESARNAQREVMLITGVSILLILLMFLLVLRSFHVIYLFLISITFSILSAISSLLIFTPEVHILTLIFGTTLIGTGIDYAVHYYLSFSETMDAEEARKRLSKSLATGFISTVVCYLLLLLSPYPLLRQVALFSTFGLASSYLTVNGLYPLIIRRSMVSKHSLAFRRRPFRIRRSYVPLLLAVSLLLLLFQGRKLHIENDISSLYSMSERMRRSEQTVGSVMGYSSTSYLVIEAENEEECSAIEDEYLSSLDALVNEGKLERYLAQGLFLPSTRVQRENIEAARKLLPLLDEQCAALGIESTKAERAIEEQEVLSYDGLDESMKSLLGAMNIGELGEHCYHMVLLFGLKGSTALPAMEGVTYMNRMELIEEQLDSLTGMILRIFIAALVLIVVLLVALYRRKGVHLSLSPLIIFISTLSLSPLLSLDIDFFFAVGLLLVIGLGLDYMVFASQEGKKPLLAITLSYLTTALSFGTLLFSSFRPVHIFGLTVFTGITIAYLIAILSGSSHQEE